MGEALMGVGRQFPTFAYVFFSMGLGGAVVIDGRVFSGVFGNAGEFAGVWPADEHDERPTLELLRKTLASHGTEHPDIYAMISDFDVDAPGVEDWIERALPRLDQMASAISAVLDPEAIVLGGRIPKRLAERLTKRMTFYGVPRRGTRKPVPEIVVSTVDGDAAAIGAAATPLKARFFA
jgi:predicted NBD/HSP70 family sugar kinase